MALFIARPWAAAALGACFIVGAVVRLVIDDVSMALGLVVFTPVVVPMLTLGFLTGRGLVGLGGSLAGNIENAKMSEGACPCCGYTLLGAGQEADGCVVCPECGAAWSGTRLSRAISGETEVVVIRSFPSPEESVR